METAQKLHDEFQSCLNLTYRYAGKSSPGSSIVAGTRFRLWFTLKNISGMGNVVFNNARIFIKGTTFARPVDGDKWLKFDNEHLKPGEETSVTLWFLANEAWTDPTKDIIEASAWADLDYLTFFSFGTTEIVRQDIYTP